MNKTQKLKIMQKKLLQLLFICSFFMVFLPATAQNDAEEAKQEAENSLLSVDFGADIMSRYVWRGQALSSTPSIQPGMELSIGGLAFGAWGAYSFDGLTDGAEADLYLSYTFLNDMLSVTVTDYFFPTDAIGASNDYWRYGEDNTGHLFEGSLSFNGTDDLPLTLLVATNFYGADAKKVESDTLSDNFNEEIGNAYSTYIEVGYSFSVNDVDLSAFVGFTPNSPQKADAETGYLGESGFYGDYMGVVNLGITGVKEIKITESYALPVNASVITNPMSENIYIVFGISF